MTRFIRILACALISSASFAGDHHTPAKISKDFEKMKMLVGTWEGTSKMEGKDMPVSVRYALTSGGTALTETLGAGSEHEMISVYSTNGKKTSMTHYCSMGNQPELALKKVDDKSAVFEMVGTKGIQSPKEDHMHALTITFLSPDSIKHEWTSYKNGKKNETATFNFTRKKG